MRKSFSPTLRYVNRCAPKWKWQEAPLESHWREQMEKRGVTVESYGLVLMARRKYSKKSITNSVIVIDKENCNFIIMSTAPEAGQWAQRWAKDEPESFDNLMRAAEGWHHAIRRQRMEADHLAVQAEKRRRAREVRIAAVESRTTHLSPLERLRIRFGTYES